jgi:Protein of unknown function (DUF2442)
MFLHTTKVHATDHYTLYAEFNNGAKGTIDLSHELWGDMFAPLKNKTLFATASQDSVMQTVRWDNGADLAPEFLYDLMLLQGTTDNTTP